MPFQKGDIIYPPKEALSPQERAAWCVIGRARGRTFRLPADPQAFVWVWQVVFFGETEEAARAEAVRLTLSGQQIEYDVVPP